jgi:hypothetical protein
MEDKSRQQRAKEAELVAFLAYPFTQKMEAWRQHIRLWFSDLLLDCTALHPG